MTRLIAAVVLMLAMVCGGGAVAKEAYQPSSDTVSAEVRRDFEKILDVWHDGKYDELYARTHGGKDTRESFTKRVADAPLHPAYSWEKIQDVTITVKGDSSAVIHAKLGFEGGSVGTEFKTKSFKLVKEGGVWKVARAEILSLAEAKKSRKKKTTHHY